MNSNLRKKRTVTVAISKMMGIIRIGIICFFCVSVVAPSYGNYTEPVFVENKGQWPEEVAFSASIEGGRIFITQSGFKMVFYNQEQSHETKHFQNQLSARSTSPTEVEFIDMHSIEMKMVGSNGAQSIEGVKELPTKYSFFSGKDQLKWVKGARAFSSIQLNQIYKGVDMRIYADGKLLKYDLIVSSGTDPSIIKMKYLGADKLELINNQLKLTTSVNVLTEDIPLTYSTNNDETDIINCTYKLAGNEVTFDVDEYNPAHELVIDPLLVFSTYSGSAADNWGNTATYDAQGNAYAGGMTNHERGGTFVGEFPATNGAFQTQYGGIWDVALLKFDSTGTDLLYASYLGGSESEVPQSIIVNEAGELLILGITSSPDFPVTSNAYDQTFNGGENAQIFGVPYVNGSDLFIAKLSADGSELLASTFLGGSANDGMLLTDWTLVNNYGDESRGDINFDSNGNIVIASRSSSADFPIKSAFQSSYGGGNVDAIVVNFDPDLSTLNWSTYIGGLGEDVALSVKIDANDNIYVGGGTTSSDFPSTSSALHPAPMGGIDGWVLKMDVGGQQVLASSFIGTPSYDQVFFLDLDGDGNVFLAGQTTGNYPSSTGLFSQGATGQFIHKLSANLEESIWSTVIGSEGSSIPNISLTAFLVNDCNNIYLSGWGSNLGNFAGVHNFLLDPSGMPVSSDALQATSDGSSFYLMVLSGDASELLYGTFFGDANSYVHVDGGTSRFDKHGIVYHSVCASCTGDSSFPTTEGAWSNNNGSSGCNNAVFKFDLASLRARIQSNNTELNNPGYDFACTPMEVVFQNKSTGGKIYDWDFGDGETLSTSDTTGILHVYENTGIYQVSLRAYDPNTCSVEDFTNTIITASNFEHTITENTTICEGSEQQLRVIGGSTYQWEPEESLSDVSISNPFVSPSDTTWYKVKISDDVGCEHLDSTRIAVVPNVSIDIVYEWKNLCEGERHIVFTNNSEFAEEIEWTLMGSSISNELAPEIRFEEDGRYEIEAILTNAFCMEAYTLNLEVQKLSIPNVITRNADDLNDVFKIKSILRPTLKIYNRWGVVLYESQSYDNTWQGASLPAGTYYYQAVFENKDICNGWVQLLDGE